MSPYSSHTNTLLALPSRPRSLRHEYELYIEEEIDAYKEALPRSALLRIGDEAAAGLAADAQLVLTELVLCDEVDRIIRDRLRLPSYKSWRARRLRLLAKYRRPEHWGLGPDHPLVAAMEPTANDRVLVTGAAGETRALYFAAHGCDVTAVDTEPDVVERVLALACNAGLTSKVHGMVADLAAWAPDGAFSAVICSPKAFEGLAPADRIRVIELLKSATRDGGVHLVETIVAGQHGMTIDDLRARYAGWTISVQRAGGAPTSFLARKGGGRVAN